MKETSLIKEFCVGFFEGFRQAHWERLLVGVVATLVIYGIDSLHKKAVKKVKRTAKRFDLDDFGVSLN